MPERDKLPVVVTRPLAQAAPLAERLKQAGRDCVLFPLLDIVPLDDDSALRAELARLNRYALVAFVSPNAIEAVFARAPQWPPEVALAVMGQGSRDTLARFGLDQTNARIYSPRDPVRTDSTTLLEVLDLAALRGRDVLIVRGTDGREFLADALREAGVQVTQVAAYRREPPALTPALADTLRDLLDRRHDWVVTSSEALRHALQLAREAGGDALVAKMLQQRLVVSHVRIAQTASALGFADVMQTASGDEALTGALQYRP
ncbi:MAG TPA: uroporphyrinogen-III synthase [Burkholderiaceae bacterium]